MAQQARLRVYQQVPSSAFPVRAIFVPSNFDDFLLVAEGLWVDANAFQHVNELVWRGLVLLLCLLVAACPHKDGHGNTHHQHRGPDEASRYW